MSKFANGMTRRTCGRGTDGSSGTLGEVTAELGDVNLASNPFYSQPCDNGPAMRSLFIGLRANTENGYADDLHNATRATNEQNYWRVA